MLFLEQTQGFGAHASIGDHQPPSLFELLMQERMAGGFKPALEYLAQTLCDAYPQLSTALPVRHLDESYALLTAVVERYFLRRYDSLASEKFYGIKRVMYVAPDATAGADAKATTAPLAAHARRQSLLYAALVPYIKAKLDHLHRRLAAQAATSIAGTQATRAEQEQVQDTLTTSSALERWRRALQRCFQQIALLARLKKAFIKGYPFAHLVYEGSFFLYQWLYLFGDTPYFSPLLRRMGVALVRVTPNDESTFVQQQSEYRDKLLASLGDATLLQRARRVLLRTTWAVYDHSYVLLMLGIAGYKFLEWMYSDEGGVAKIRLTGTDAPIPPPPLPPSFAGNASVALSTLDDATCPLCQRRRVNPAASVSGFVFCYPCLYRHVESHGACPVTQMKCDVTSIVKIYDEGSA